MSTYYLQTAFGLLAGAIMSAAWWYAAIKFPRTWIFSALAIVATITILLYAGILLLIASGNTRLVGAIAGVQVLLHLTEAVLLVLLVRWLAAALKDQNKP
jgi:hypothetical protein